MSFCCWSCWARSAWPPLAGAAAETKCPFTFRVLHNDRIGALQLPAGNYDIFVINQAQLSCEHATDLFRQFLEDWDGRLPRPWINVRGTATFTRGSGSTIGFRVARASGGGGGGGGGNHPHGGTTCPSYFTVLHNDHIGRFRIPRGPVPHHAAVRGPAVVRSRIAPLRELPAGLRRPPAAALGPRPRDGHLLHR